MKVYLGPYPNDRLNIYCILNKLERKGYISEETCDTWTERLYPITNPISKVLNWRNKRKIKVYIDPHDVWGLDDTLALIIAPSLRLLKQRKQGSPYVEDEDVPEALRSYNATEPKENEWDTDGNHHKRWEWVLDEMIFAFEQLEKNALDEEDYEAQFYTGETDYITEEIEGTDLVECKQGPNHTFKVDEEGLAAFNDRMNNGFRLFGVYFRNLWD